jgi:hypothetical protein
MKTPGQIAYEAYCPCVNWTSFQGYDLPPWEESPGHIQLAWEAAARAVLEQTDAASQKTP